MSPIPVSHVSYQSHHYFPCSVHLNQGIRISSQTFLAQCLTLIILFVPQMLGGLLFVKEGDVVGKVKLCLKTSGNIFCRKVWLQVGLVAPVHRRQSITGKPSSTCNVLFFLPKTLLWNSWISNNRS